MNDPGRSVARCDAGLGVGAEVSDLMSGLFMNGLTTVISGLETHHFWCFIGLSKFLQCFECLSCVLVHFAMTLYTFYWKYCSLFKKFYATYMYMYCTL